MASHWNDNAHGVRRLGFGVGGPHGTPIVTSRQTADMIQRAFELGVRYFDTGPSYGAGEAERRLGEAMQRLPRLECIISTKVGISSSGLATRKRDFSPDGVRRSVDESLARLRDTRVDWLFLHGASAEELTDELFQTLEELRYWGKVGAVGFCGRGPEIDAAIECRQFTLIMAPLHIALEREDLDRLARVRAANIDLIGIEALAPSLPKWAPPTSAGAIYRNARTFRNGPQLPPHERVPAKECLRWALDVGGAQRIITSTTRISHLEENAAAVSTLR